MELMKSTLESGKDFLISGSCKMQALTRRYPTDTITTLVRIIDKLRARLSDFDIFLAHPFCLHEIDFKSPQKGNYLK